MLKCSILQQTTLCRKPNTNTVKCIATQILLIPQTHTPPHTPQIQHSGLQQTSTHNQPSTTQRATNHLRVATSCLGPNRPGSSWINQPSPSTNLCPPKPSLVPLRPNVLFNLGPPFSYPKPTSTQTLRLYQTLLSQLPTSNLPLSPNQVKKVNSANNV